MAHSARWHFVHTVRFALHLPSSTVVIVALRFLIVVLSAYKQIRAQSKDVLCDVGEDNFNKAFHFLRPGKDHTH
jgi:hypothetical protein